MSTLEVDDRIFDEVDGACLVHRDGDILWMWHAGQYCNAHRIETGDCVDAFALSDEVRAKGPKHVRELLEAHIQASDLAAFTIALDNMDDREGFVLAIVRGPRAAAWAKNQQTIAGESWECDGPDFAYAMPLDSPDLAEELEGEGYDLDLSEYSPPEVDR